jgi:hypothetical protein
MCVHGMDAEDVLPNTRVYTNTMLSIPRINLTSVRTVVKLTVRRQRWQCIVVWCTVMAMIWMQPRQT